MRVGILTFHLVRNHGAYLQAFCLVEAIRQLGHNAEVINYVNHCHWNTTKFKPWVYRRPARFWHDLRAHLAFRKAFARLPMSQFTTDPNKVPWNSYDAIVIGSDIVWNYQDWRLGHDPVYFGVFPVDYRGRLIAYAPSIGGMNWNAQVPAWVSDGLRRFHAIGVRDANTRQFVQQHTGHAPLIVADPTWLTDAELSCNPSLLDKKTHEFLLVYCFHREERITSAIRAFATCHRLRTVAVGYWQNWCDENWANLDPFQWANTFHQARYVVTGTLHGTLYSIKQRAQFCVLSHPAIDTKVATPLATVGLAERIVSNPAAIADVLLKRIDYTGVDHKRIAYGRESLEFLKQALS